MSKTYVDQVPPETGRKYSITANPDGTSKIEDVTEYVQEGTAWGAGDANDVMFKSDYDPDGTLLDDLDALQTDVTTLKKGETVFTTAGTAPAFTIADTSVTAYAAGLRRTVQFHANGTNATLNFNGKGAKALYEYTGKQMSVKASQVVEVYYNGTYFFGVSVGGGVSFPSTPAAGETPILAVLGPVSVSTTSYANVAGRGFTAVKAGVYRVKYDILYAASSPFFAQLTKNGTAVSGSEITDSAATGKVIDVALTAGDVLRLQAKKYTTTSMGTSYFCVSMLASEVQAEVDAILTVVP